MKIDILRLREGPITEDVYLDPVYLGEGSEEGVTFDPGRGQVTFRMIGNDIIAMGKLRSAVHAPCGRCLNETTLPINADVHLYYWPKREETGSKIEDIDPEEPDFGEYEGDFIEPDEDLREILLVEMPYFIVCKEECKGLCPHCGANLNEETCDCHDEEEEEPRTSLEKPVKESSWKAQLKAIKLPPAE